MSGAKNRHDIEVVLSKEWYNEGVVGPNKMTDDEFEQEIAYIRRRMKVWLTHTRI